ncbi:MAG: hypothetical protein DU489_03235 [Nitrosomonas sp.]|uniref:hypothetical protein n=1 Tax=Nitrosomonas sp. TaxID=42353 RepID=UPI0032EE1311
MGYKFQNYCFDTKQEFLDYFAQSCFKQGGSGGLSSYFLTCSSNTDDVTIQAYAVSSGSPQTAFTYAPQLISCDSANSFADAVSFGWQLAAILAVAFGVRVIIKVLNQ